MGKYNVIRSEMWSDTAVRSLTPGGKLLYNYILSSPASNLMGYYKLEVMQIKTNLCRIDKSKGKFNEADEKFFDEDVLPQLTGEDKLWKYDTETEQIIIPNYLKYNKVNGPKQYKAMEDQLKTMSLCTLHVDFYVALLRYIGEDAIAHMPTYITKQVEAMCNTNKDLDSEKVKEIMPIISIPFLT